MTLGKDKSHFNFKSIYKNTTWEWGLEITQSQKEKKEKKAAHASWKAPWFGNAEFFSSFWLHNTSLTFHSLFLPIFLLFGFSKSSYSLPLNVTEVTIHSFGNYVFLDYCTSSTIINFLFNHAPGSPTTLCTASGQEPGPRLSVFHCSKIPHPLLA